MKAIWLFYLGAGVDILGLCIAVYFMLSDSLKGTSGTNNPTMFSATLALGFLVMAGFWLKNAGKMALANVVVWIPGFPLFLYGLFIVLFLIGKPDMR